MDSIFIENNLLKQTTQQVIEKLINKLSLMIKFIADKT